MPGDKEASLPRWAHVMKNGADKDEPTAKQEEMFLRTRTYHALAHRVDEAVEHAIQTHTSPLVDQIQDFFDMAMPMRMTKTPTEVDDNLTRTDPTSPRPNKRLRRTSPGKSPLDELHDLLSIEKTAAPIKMSPVEELHELLAIEPPKHHCPSLLPVAMVQSPASLLDRREVLRQLSSSFQRNRPAICWLHTLGEHHRHGSLMEEIVRQCIRQEPRPATYESLLKQQHNGKNYSSWTQALLAWAQHTLSFDSIVILLENVEGFMVPTLQDFLQLLNSVRSEHGVPVNVVMLCLQDGREGLQLHSSSQGMVGMLVRDFSLPSSRVLYERIWELLWIEPDYRLPVMLPASTLRCIRESFVNHHASAVRAATMVKQALGHHLSQPGSFFAGTECDELMKQEWNRMAWFCVDKSARECVIGKGKTHSDDFNSTTIYGSTMMSWLEAVEKCRRALWVVLRLLQDICKRGPSRTPEWLEDVLSSTTSCAHDEVSSRVSGLLRGLSQKEILIRLARWRREIHSLAQNTDAKTEARKLFEKYVDNSSSSKSGSDSMLLQDLLDRLDDLIILADKDYSGESANVEKRLMWHLEGWVRAVFLQGALLLDKPYKDSNPLACSLIMSETHAKLGIESMTAQPRRSVAVALLNPTREPENDDDPATFVPSEMFRVIRNRIDIARDDWFQLFLQNVNTGRPREEAWSLFAFGIYQLLHCGLIREKRGTSKAQNVYEKAALVWCSGE